MKKLTSHLALNRSIMLEFGECCGILVASMDKLIPKAETTCRHVFRNCGASYAAMLPLDKSPHTLKNWVSILRKDFRKGMDRAPESKYSDAAYEGFCSGFRLPDHVAADVASRAGQRQDERASGVSMLWVAPIISHLRDTIATMPIHAAAAEMLLAALITGRRFSEINVTNFQFPSGSGNYDEIAPGYSKVPDTHRLMFSGQLKTRRPGEPPRYLIPTLLPSKHAMATVAAVSHHPGVRAINEVGHGMVDAGVWPSGTDAPRPNARGMRSVYAMATLAKWKCSNTQDWAWVNAVLGHEPGDMDTPQTYMRWSVEDAEKIK